MVPPPFDHEEAGKLLIEGPILEVLSPTLSLRLVWACYGECILITVVVTPFGVAGKGKASREIACIGHSVLQYVNLKIRCDIVFSLDHFNINNRQLRCQ